MAFLLNAVNLLLCLQWFQRSGSGTGRILGIVGAFLGGTVLSFAIAWAIAHDYLDGVGHLLIAGVSVFVFWATALVLLFRRANRNKLRVVPGEVAVLCLVLVVPAVIALSIMNMRFTIGG